MKTENKFPILVILFGIACAILIYFVEATASQPVSIQMSFIDVGEGDATLIQTSEGYNILIDGGKASAGPKVLSYLHNNGADTLAAIVVSHPDSDHIGGLISILEATDITVNAVIYNGYPGDTQTWNDFVTAVENEGLTLTTARFPGELHWGTTTAYILNPPAGLVNPDTNEASLVLLLDHNQIETLFTGDIDSGVEAEVIARETPIAADILKVAHHGSNDSTSNEFLYSVRPQDSMIPVGPNPYGHPGAEAIGRLLASGTNVWMTDFSGTITVISSDGISYEVVPSTIYKMIFLPLVNRK